MFHGGAGGGTDQRIFPGLLPAPSNPAPRDRRCGFGIDRRAAQVAPAILLLWRYPTLQPLAALGAGSPGMTMPGHSLFH
jgi:hypothetical protein